MIRDDILEGMATVLWGLAWADHVEEHKCANLSGAEITEIMPPIPDATRKEAERLAQRFEDANGCTVQSLYLTAANACAFDHEYAHEPNRFGECLAYEILGHGVSWEDDHVPYRHIKIHDEDMVSRDHADTHCDGKKTP